MESVTCNQLLDASWQHLQAVEQMIGSTASSSEELQITIAALSESLQSLRHGLSHDWKQGVSTTDLHELETEYQHYRELFEFAPDGYLVTDTKGTIQLANRAALLLLGPNLPGSDLVMLIEPDSRETFQTLLGQLQRGQNIKRREIQVRAQTGEVFEVMLTIRSVVNDRGEIVGLRWWVQDITDAKHAERSLQRSHQELEARVTTLTAGIKLLEEQLQTERNQRPSQSPRLSYEDIRFRSLIHNASDLVQILSPDGKIQYTSSALTYLLGYSPDTSIGKSFFEYIHAEDLPLVRSYVEGLPLARSGNRPTLVYRKQHANGDWVYLESIGQNLMDDPAIAGLVITSRDVTERVLGEEILRESEARFQRMFLAAPLGMALVNLEGGIIYSNPALRDILGYSEGELQRLSFQDFLYRQDPATLNPYIEHWQQGEVDCYQVEQQYLHKDGTVLWAALTAVPLHNQEGEMRYALAMVEDITERKQAETDLQQLYGQLTHKNRLLDTILSVTPDRFYLFDRSKRLIYLNRAGLEFLGTEESGILGKTAQEILLPIEMIEPCLAQLDRVLKHGQALTGEGRCLHPVSGLRFSSYHLTPIYTPEGAIETILVISRDITAHKQAELEIYRREQSFRTIAENSPDLIIRFDHEGRYLYLNPTVAEVLQRSPEEFWNTTLLEVNFGQTSVDQLYSKLRQVFLTGQVEICEFDFATTGNLRHYQLLMVPELSKDGVVEFVLGVARDITELKRQQANSLQLQTHLTQQMALLDAILSSISEQLYLLDWQQRFVYVNRAGLDFLQIEAEEIIGQTVESLEMLPDLLRGSNVPLRLILDCGEVVTIEDSHLDLEPNGQYMQYTYTPIRGNEGHYESLLIAVKDITAFKRATLALHESESRNRSFLAAVPDLVFLLDAEGTILECPTDAYNYLPVSPNLLIGKSVHEVAPPALTKFAMKAIQQTFSLATPQNFEYTLSVQGTSRKFLARLARCGEDKVIAVVREVGDAQLPALSPANSNNTPERSGIPVSALTILLDQYNVGERNFTRINLAGQDLKGIKLNGANLHRASFCGADLNGSDLSNVNLQMSDLRGVNLRGAKLIRTNLSWADLRGADLCGADLTEADLTGVSLADVNLVGTILTHATITDQIDDVNRLRKPKDWYKDYLKVDSK